LAASKTPATDFIVKLSVPVGAGAALGTVFGLVVWLLTPAYWAVIGFFSGRRVEEVDRGDASLWALWGGFLGAVGLTLFWTLEYEHLL